MKPYYTFYEPCFIDGQYVDDQEKLKEHYAKVDESRRRGKLSFNQIEARASGATVPMASRSTADLLTDHINKKVAREAKELSTEYGRLLKNHPGELQRILTEEPERYENMAKLHTLTMAGND
jgi:hypothetical protein